MVLVFLITQPLSVKGHVLKHELLYIPVTINLALKQHVCCLCFFKATANPPSAGDTHQEIRCRVGLQADQ